MDVLGHSQVAVTLNIYSHITPEVSGRRRRRLEARLRQGRELRL